MPETNQNQPATVPQQPEAPFSIEEEHSRDRRP